MTTSDLKVWKELFTELQSAADQNEQALAQARAVLQEKENESKQKLLDLCSTIKNQNSQLESLYQQIQEYSFPGEAAVDDPAVQERISKNHDLIELADEVLSEAPAAAYKEPAADSKKVDAAEPAKKQEAPEQAAPEAVEEVVTETIEESAKPAKKKHKFDLDQLLGNWIHNFSDTQFTCQSFWQDGAFKEYDFNDGRLVEERAGTFTITPGTLNLHYDEGKDAVYKVESYNYDDIYYDIDGVSVKFEYMPEDLLNRFLEDDGATAATL
jgi:hypothetical protein